MSVRYGLDEVYAPPAAIPIAALIIFVHGLNGHPRRTWTTPKAQSESHTASQSQRGELRSLSSRDSGSVFWPKDLLPQIVNNAKILTWGYDANINGFVSAASQNTVRQHAMNILSDISDHDEASVGAATPIIFVVYSLGGIIVKDALNLSRQMEDSRLGKITPRVRGICFLGTPHRGSSSASIGTIAYNIIRLSGCSPNMKLLRSLQKESDTLERIGDDFIQTLAKHKDMNVRTFLEEKKARVLWFIQSMIVTSSSAKIGCAREDPTTIPANHSNISKFSCASDVGFKTLSLQLHRWVGDCTMSQNRHRIAKTGSLDDCLKSLEDAQISLRMRSVTKNHPKTFEWLFDPQKTTFSEWLTNSGDEDFEQVLHENGGALNSIFWIQGKPASGKSTLMKFALDDPRVTSALHRNHNISIIASHFFHDRGTEEQKSLVGMLQGLLFQILSTHKPLFNTISAYYQKLSEMQQTKLPRWDLETLELAILGVLRRAPENIRFCLFIDALDEHDGDNRRLIRLVSQLTAGNQRRVKICLASRPWTIFSSQLRGYPGLTLQDHTKSDISLYVMAKLDESRCEAKISNRFAQIIIDKAHGVFIWVRLVVDAIVTGIVDGTSTTEMLTWVDQLPEDEELDDLYTRTLLKIKPKYRVEGFDMLHLVYVSLLPMPLALFMECLSSDYSSTSSVLSSANAQKDPDQPEEMARRLESRSGGLLECIDLSFPSSSRNDGTRSSTRVQFIHQTAKDFFKGNKADIAKKLGVGPRLEEVIYLRLMKHITYSTSVKTWLRGSYIVQYFCIYANHFDAALDIRSINYELFPNLRTLLLDALTGQVFSAENLIDLDRVYRTEAVYSVLWPVSPAQEKFTSIFQNRCLEHCKLMLDKWIQRDPGLLAVATGMIHTVSIFVQETLEELSHPVSTSTWQSNSERLNAMVLLAALGPSLGLHQEERAPMVGLILDWSFRAKIRKPSAKRKADSTELEAETKMPFLLSPSLVPAPSSVRVPPFAGANGANDSNDYVQHNYKEFLEQRLMPSLPFASLEYVRTVNWALNMTPGTLLLLAHGYNSDSTRLHIMKEFFKFFESYEGAADSFMNSLLPLKGRDRITILEYIVRFESAAMLQLLSSYWTPLATDDEKPKYSHRDIRTRAKLISLAKIRRDRDMTYALNDHLRKQGVLDYSHWDIETRTDQEALGQGSSSIVALSGAGTGLII